MYNVDRVDKAEELNLLLASLNPTTVFGGFAIKLITCEKPQKKPLRSPHFTCLLSIFNGMAKNALSLVFL